MSATQEMVYTSDITVRLIQSMGGDHMVLAAMQVSSNGEDCLRFLDLPPEDSAGKIRYLMKHRHGTPFEHSSLTFFVHAPIFCWREWHRHRIGFCVAGSTEVWADRKDNRNGRVITKLKLSDLYKRWNYGVLDSMGRTRFLKSVKNQTLRVLNENNHLFERGTISSIVKSGIKECYLLSTDDYRGFSLRASKDHRILTPDGWAKIEELSSNDCVYVSGKRNANERMIPPSLRSGIGVWTSMQRTKLIKPIDKCYFCKCLFLRDELILDHMIPVVMNLKKALDTDNLKAMCIKCHREKSNSEQKLSDRNIVAGSKLVRVKGKPSRVSEEMTYDVCMNGPWHNFVANGIIVHNSYNEESGRYKTLDPVFYIPPRERPMMKVDDWKPGRPKFLRCEKDLTYDALCANLKYSYQVSYNCYLDNLSLNIDPGLARDCLPVGIYSSCWVTTNPRALMNFLSLRTHDEKANHPSYPLYEIEVAARKCEEIFAKGWPITYKAWNDFGRVAP